MINVIKGDITRFAGDAVVNAANTSLLGGGGVDGAIHRAGGPAILEECRKIRSCQGGCKVGDAVITTGGALASRYVIHTVGPVWNGGKNNEEELLANAYRSSLQLARDNNIHTIAFPNISTGIYHFPKERAAEIAIGTVKNFLNDGGADMEVTFICFDDENYRLYEVLLKEREK